MSAAMEDAKRWLREALSELETVPSWSMGVTERKPDMDNARECTERALDALRRLAPSEPP